MPGQAHHLRYAPIEISYARARSKEAKRLYGVLDKRLSEARFLAGDDYSIADMAVWPRPFTGGAGVDADAFPNFKLWFEEIAARPAVTWCKLADRRRAEMSRREEFSVLQYERR